MKKLALFSLIFINTCYADQLTSYQDTVNALNNGKRITFVVDWDLCKTSVPDVKPNFSSSYSPDVVTLDKSGFLQSSGVRYTFKLAKLPQLGQVNQAYVYNFTNENELHVINRFIDPVTYTEKMPAVEATCKLGEGFKVFD
jgi:hypothetical protein